MFLFSKKILNLFMCSSLDDTSINLSTIGFLEKNTTGRYIINIDCQNINCRTVFYGMKQYTVVFKNKHTSYCMVL